MHFKNPEFLSSWERTLPNVGVCFCFCGIGAQCRKGGKPKKRVVMGKVTQEDSCAQSADDLWAQEVKCHSCPSMEELGRVSPSADSGEGVPREPEGGLGLSVHEDTVDSKATTPGKNAGAAVSREAQTCSHGSKGCWWCGTAVTELVKRTLHELAGTHALVFDNIQDGDRVDLSLPRPTFSWKWLLNGFLLWNVEKYFFKTQIMGKSQVG